MDKARIRELERAEAKLQALEAGGVDNWDGYDFSLEDFYKYEEAEKKIAEAVNEIQETLAMEIYEPSERGAGWAVTEAGCDSIESILRELIRKNN